MLVGLLHSHSGLAYVVFFAALLNLFLGLKATTSKEVSAVYAPLRWSHLIFLWGGRFNVLLGLIFWMMGNFIALNLTQQWWAILSLLLWGPIEVMSKRFVQPELEVLSAGAKADKRLTIGVAVQLLCITLIFGMMSAH